MACLPLRRASTRSTVDLVPNGLPQLTQWKGSSRLDDLGRHGGGGEIVARLERITFSGQVATQIPHCTQALSVKESCGRSGLSESAAVGQAPTQARQSVQPAMSTWMRP